MHQLKQHALGPHRQRDACAHSAEACDRRQGAQPIQAHETQTVFDALDHALEQVHLANKARDEAGGGFFIDGARDAQLFDAPRPHDRDALGHDHGLVLIVGHEHEGRAQFPLQAHQFELRLLAQLAIQRR